jgi:hypothetical protein
MKIAGQSRTCAGDAAGEATGDVAGEATGEATGEAVGESAPDAAVAGGSRKALTRGSGVSGSLSPRNVPAPM